MAYYYNGSQPLAQLPKQPLAYSDFGATPPPAQQNPQQAPIQLRKDQLLFWLLIAGAVILLIYVLRRRARRNPEGTELQQMFEQYRSSGGYDLDPLALYGEDDWHAQNISEYPPSTHDAQNLIELCRVIRAQQHPTRYRRPRGRNKIVQLDTMPNGSWRWKLSRKHGRWHGPFACREDAVCDAQDHGYVVIGEHCEDVVC